VPHNACRKPADVASANCSGVIPASPRARLSFGFLYDLLPHLRIKIHERRLCVLIPWIDVLRRRAENRIGESDMGDFSDRDLILAEAHAVDLERRGD
jgi:hypothetical protein